MLEERPRHEGHIARHDKTYLARGGVQAIGQRTQDARVRLHAGAWGVRRLTELFEEAMFSHHAIAVERQEEAVAALVAVRDDLRAAV